ncbi:DUF2785 domain-containing protein [Lapidilactobacillus gannanensis]|uniref:DUF2785 domain-containing protein n=1 Tax=Lapidilactobacillus gannanensis TaxID=2486002 RepID=A0ABW4BKK5_9LACO|nr:DUF2785 domain-containing protein [Lapidilactobacillus gannanensis]
MAAAEETMRVRLAVRDYYNQFSQGLNFDELTGQLRRLKRSVEYSKRRQHVAPIASGDLKTLKQTLASLEQRIYNSDNNALVSDEELDQLLSNIGILDASLRDEKILLIFNGLVGRQAFTSAQIWPTLAYLIQDDVLFSHILEPENDAAFGRAVAVILISFLLVADRLYGNVISDNQYWQVIQKLTLYAILENDARGYVPEKGWVHAYARLGNILEEVAESRLNRAQKLYFLTAVMAAYQEIKVPFAFGEDQRIAKAVVNLANKEKFYNDYLLSILGDWLHRAPSIQPSVGYDFWSQRYNREHFFTNVMLMPEVPHDLIKFIKKIPELFG